MMRLLVLGVGGKAAIWSSSEPWPTNSHATILWDRRGGE